MHSARINQLQQEISEKDAELQFLMKKCHQLESSLSSSETKIMDLTVVSNKLEQENKQMKLEHHSALSGEINKRNEVEIKLLLQIGSFKEQVVLLEQKVEEYKKVEMQKQHLVEKLQTTVTTLEAEKEDMENDFKMQIKMLKEKHAVVWKENENLKQKELVQEEALESAKFKIQSMELHKEQFEMEINNLKHEIASGKLLVEKRLEEQHKEMEEQTEAFKQEQQLLKEKMEELNATLEIKRKQEEVLKSELEVLYQLQDKVALISEKLDAKSVEAECLQQRLLAAEEEVKVQVAKVKLDVKEQLEEFEETKKLNHELSAEVKSLQEKLLELEVLHNQQLQEKDVYIHQLKNEQSDKEKKIQEIISLELNNANELKVAVNSYLSEITETLNKLR